VPGRSRLVRRGPAELTRRPPAGGRTKCLLDLWRRLPGRVSVETKRVVNTQPFDRCGGLGTGSRIRGYPQADRSGVRGVAGRIALLAL
jgi:hypothetical protein